MRYYFACLLLWLACNGSAQALVKDINIGPAGSNPTGFCRMDSFVFFIADDGVHGYELWVTDGTDAGTRIVKDINPGTGDGCLYHSDTGPHFAQIQALGHSVYFFANDGVYGFELWRSDGTELGTTLVKDIMRGPASSTSNLTLLRIDSILIFPAADSTHGMELWRSDGTNTGTVMVKDIHAGFYSSNPQCFFTDSGVVYFSAGSDTGGFGLYKSNGTAEGTVRPGQAVPTPSLNDSSPFIKYNSEVYYNGFTLDNGAELWKTNGTAEGTLLVKDINPGASSGGPAHFAICRNMMAFTANDGPHSYELWCSNGTAEGTRMVKDICPGHRGSRPSELTVLDTSLFFVASDSEGRMQLWQSDLTDSGTRVFEDSATGWRCAQPQILGRSGKALYLSCNGAETGSEIWITNGTAKGTKMLPEICGGPCSSNPGSIYPFDSLLLLPAEDIVHGRELFQVGRQENLMEEVMDSWKTQVYPDPLRKELERLRSTGRDIEYLKVFDLGGNELLRQDARKPIPASVASFPDGIYVLRAYDSNDRCVAFTRFMKQ